MTKLSKQTFLSLLGPKTYTKEKPEVYGYTDKTIYKGKLEETGGFNLNDKQLKFKQLPLEPKKPIEPLNERITYQGQDYLLNTYLSSWLTLSRDDLRFVSSMPRDPQNQICIEPEPKPFRCPQDGKMPWWQDPDCKWKWQLCTSPSGSTIVGSPTPGLPPTGDPLCFSCSTWPEPNNSLLCPHLYELDDPNPENKPTAVENHAPSKEFISVYQKWVDDNKNHPYFDGKYRDAVILFFGYLRGGIDPITSQPRYKNNRGQWDPGVCKVFLETYMLNSRYKLIRNPNSFDTDQLEVYRHYIYLTNAPAIVPPLPVGDKNILITFNMMTCKFEEFIVNKPPEAMIPEIILVKYIPNIADRLSVLDPVGYSKLESLYKRRFAATCRTGIIGCQSLMCQPIVKDASSKKRDFFEKLTVPWSIKSFDPSSRSVRIEIKNKSTTVNMSVTLPPIISK